MKHVLLNTLMISLITLALVACNDEVRNDHDRDRTEENSKQLPGAEKPSDFVKDYDSLSQTKSSTPDSLHHTHSDSIH